ncbi:MAG: hypothetical protein QOC92_365 [Acidimicrobiaceae bacterium]
MHAARSLSRRAAAKLARPVKGWPESSPGAVNAWLLLVTTKPPAWRDALLEWREQPLSVGQLHEGFLYPDPIGFWAEVRRWSVELLRTFEPRWDASEALAVTALIHVGTHPGALEVAVSSCRPSVVLFLDEPAWQASGWEVQAAHYNVPDPHRDGQAYQGFWGRRPDGLVVGKAPQHPTMHRFYTPDDMTRYLRGIGDIAPHT